MTMLFIYVTVAFALGVLVTIGGIGALLAYDTQKAHKKKSARANTGSLSVARDPAHGDSGGNLPATRAT